MSLNQEFRGGCQSIFPPVFDGLETLGFSGLDIAEIACVSPPTISKWRNGSVFIPNEYIILLTLVLASRLIDVHEENDCYKMPSQACKSHRQVDLETARQNLEAQEKINYNLPSSAVRTGAILFRYWWHTQQRVKTTEMRMNDGQANQFLAAY